VEGPARREIESSPEIGLAWDGALYDMKIPGVTKDLEENIIVPEGVRVVFRELFIKILSRYLHVWQGEFIRIHSETISLQKVDPLRKKLKNKYRSTPDETDPV
jgi:hypothetical protein